MDTPENFNRELQRAEAIDKLKEQRKAIFAERNKLTEEFNKAFDENDIKLGLIDSELTAIANSI